MAFDISTTDIESRWRSLSADESDVAFARLEDAALKLRLARPTLDTYVNGLPPGALRTDLEAAIRIALAEAVIRYLRNPDLLRSQTVGADGAVGMGFETDGDRLEASSGVFIAESDLAVIDAAVATAGGETVPRVRSRVLTTSFPYRTAITGDVTILPTP
jgi:hypothetical protein